MTPGNSFVSARTPTHLFGHAIDILRPTSTLDTGGSPISTYSTWRSGVPAHVQPRPDAYLDPLAGRRVYKQSIRVYLDPSIAICPADRIAFNGKTYEQTGSGSDLLATGVIRRIDCREVVE